MNNTEWFIYEMTTAARKHFIISNWNEGIFYVLYFLFSFHFTFNHHQKLNKIHYNKHSRKWIILTGSNDKSKEISKSANSNLCFCNEWLSLFQMLFQVPLVEFIVKMGHHKWLSTSHENSKLHFKENMFEQKLQIIYNIWKICFN